MTQEARRLEIIAARAKTLVDELQALEEVSRDYGEQLAQALEEVSKEYGEQLAEATCAIQALRLELHPEASDG